MQAAANKTQRKKTRSPNPYHNKQQHDGFEGDYGCDHAHLNLVGFTLEEIPIELRADGYHY